VHDVRSTEGGEVTAAYGIIYYARHLESGKGYVGQTTARLAQRIRKHFGAVKNALYFGRALRHHGLDAFEIKEIDSAESAKELSTKEREWIQRLGTFHPAGYNLTLGGEGATGYNPPSDLRERIANKLRGRKLSAETLAKRGLVPRSESTRAKIAAYQRGQKRSNETRRNQSIAQRSLNKRISEEQKQRLREINLGKTLSIETRTKMSMVRKGKPKPNGALGKKRTEEHKRKTSESMRRVWAARRQAAIED